MEEQSSKSREDLIRENEELERKLAALRAKRKLVVKKDRRIEQSQQRQLLADFAVCINRGKTRDEIINDLGISSDDFDKLHTKYYKQIEREQEGKSPLRIFSEYVSLQQEFVRTLWEFVEDSKKRNYKNAQAFVAGVRAQSEILDKIIKTGQDLGVIVKTPERLLIVDGNDARDMDSAELRHYTLRKLQQVQAMVEKSKKRRKQAKVIQFSSAQDQQEGKTG